MKEEEARIAECGIELHKQEKAFQREKRKLDQNRADFNEYADELERQRSFIASEREMLSTQRSELDSQRSLTGMYMPSNLKQVLK